MKSFFGRSPLTIWAFLLGAVVANQAQPIRLRNFTIPDDPATRHALTCEIDQSSSNTLFVIQIADRHAGWREGLRTNGIVLLKYVPENAFVARVSPYELNKIKSLPFVKWVGPYRPEYKVHSELQNRRAIATADQHVQVAIWIAPDITESELDFFRNKVTKVRQQSRLKCGVIIRGYVKVGDIPRLADSPSVLWIEPTRDMKLYDEVSSSIVAGSAGPNRLYTQSLGWDGSGVRVAVADSGLHNGDALTMHPDLYGRTPVFLWYGSLQNAADEHGHGTHVAGIIAGDGSTGRTDENGALYGLGVAPGSEIIVQRLFDGFGNYHPPLGGFEQLTREATRNGAAIGSNSWGDDTHGRYDLSAMEFDELVRDADALRHGDQPYILEFSAGNAGPVPGSIGSPAVAKNVIATGASQNDRTDLFIYTEGPEAMADFSSRGPCEDGRIKPDIVAPGTWIASLQSASAGDQYAWLPIDEFYQYQGGTSQAGPHVSGAAAVFVQFYRAMHNGQTPSPALVKAALINSATDMDDNFGTGPVPNMDEGWGRLDLATLFSPDRTFVFVDQPRTLQTGESWENSIVIASEEEELKITLVYTDPPGNPAAIPALVNDLDLECVSPSGTIYRGNQFRFGQSIPNPNSRDAINNVEGIHIAAPEPGEWKIRVKAIAVNEDARRDTEELDQDFAVVVSGKLAIPGQAVLATDRKAYKAPDQIKIFLTDTDIPDHINPSVLVKSSSEPAGELIQLSRVPGTITFTSAIPTAVGTSGSDGILQISHGDTITVEYFDNSLNRTITYLARADLSPPLLLELTIATNLGHIVIKLTTDEPTASTIRYGTNTSYLVVLSDPNLTTVHEFTLTNLAKNASYFFAITLQDEAGNVRIDDNNGAYYTFVSPKTAPVLVVDHWDVDLLGSPPPITGYTAVLDQLGVDYEVTTRQEITATDLSQFKLVIWRISELLGGLQQTHQNAISNYLYNGGALLIASMELLSRLEELGATEFIHSVLQVAEYKVDGGSPPSTGASHITGIPSSIVGQGIDIDLDYSLYYDLWWGIIGPDLSDNIVPTTNASAIFINDYGDVVGLRWPRDEQTARGRLVFLTFPLDAVPMGSGTNDRIHLVRNALDFLMPGWNPTPKLQLDADYYTVPALVKVQLSASPLAGTLGLHVLAKSDSDTNGINVPLLESDTPGVFHGAFQLIPTAWPSTPSSIKAKHGDTIQVVFESPNQPTTVATATVDTLPPTIQGAEAEPEYENAFISWVTTELADALVQYGESPILNKTAYNPAPSTMHQVQLRGLQPQKTYYYRIVSRDIAGNVAIDDNKGQLYTFTTLTPLTPPWADNFDTGDKGWSTFDGFADWGWFGQTAAWQCGPPANGLVESAHSPPNAWGCNLEGNAIEFADCYLISPAIHLQGGNVAKLRLWHCYEFDPEELEVGTVYVAPADSTSLVELRSYFGDSTDGWVLEELDLTPFIGRVIYLIWNYQLFSLSENPGPHPGWLIDDVEIVISNVIPGTIRITNNLWQATYVLYGPITFRGRGLGTIITNAPPGQYTVLFGDVPWWITPPPQTNILRSNSEITFTGHYSFTDANQNFISDEWELANFGTLDPARTILADTDGDGMSDYAEFMAGTDPNAPMPPFRINARLLTPTNLLLWWPAIPTRTYRILTSPNAVDWHPASEWINPSSNIISLSIPLTNHLAQFFRVESIPAIDEGRPEPKLALSISHIPPGTLKLRWNCTPNRAYRVLKSTDLTHWEPACDWIHPTATTASAYVPATNNTAQFFRLEVRP